MPYPVLDLLATLNEGKTRSDNVQKNENVNHSGNTIFRKNTTLVSDILRRHVLNR